MLMPMTVARADVSSSTVLLGERFEFWEVKCLPVTRSFLTVLCAALHRPGFATYLPTVSQPLYCSSYT